MKNLLPDEIELLESWSADDGLGYRDISNLLTRLSEARARLESRQAVIKQMDSNLNYGMSMHLKKNAEIGQLHSDLALAVEALEYIAEQDGTPPEFVVEDCHEAANKALEQIKSRNSWLKGET